jgi:hypothetical protein
LTGRWIVGFVAVMQNRAFEAVEDLAAADWVLANLRGFAEGVGSIVPGCFESYARVFHPASLMVTDEAEAGEGARSERWVDGTTRWQKSVRWAEVAAANDRDMHPAAEWGSITGSLDYIYDGEQPGVWDSPPELGGPPPEVAERLVDVLVKFTGTPDGCWFGVSDIWGSPLYANVQAAPKLGTDFRRYFLLKWALRSALISPHSAGERLADLWWPEDRAWFVGSDVDLLSTYVGGFDACVRALLEDGALEVLPVSVDQGVTWDSDTINPPPPPPLPD